MQFTDRVHWTVMLARQRAKLFHAYAGVSEERLNTITDDGGWTLADIFAHVTVWEMRVAQLIPAILASDTPPVPSVQGDELERRAFADIRARGFVAVMNDLVQARQAMLEALRSASDEAVMRERNLPSGKPFTVRHWAIQELADHDREHAEHARAARKASGVKFAPGPKPVLQAAFDAAHDFLMTCAHYVPAGQEATLKVTGDWTLKDVLGHVADWHFTIAGAVDDALNGKALTRVEFSKIQQWNDEHAAVRKDEPWEKVKGDYDESWRRVSAALARVSETDFTREAALNERGPISLYSWLYIAADHEEEHGNFLSDWINGA